LVLPQTRTHKCKEAARTALDYYQWLVAPDFDQEGEVQRAAASTWTLRRVEEAESKAGTRRVRFYSADWSPWLVLEQIRLKWNVDFQVKVDSH
jgi:hypothetical protein